MNRAVAEWKTITDPLQKPWKEMADAQLGVGDVAGLRRTLTELSAQQPPAGLTGSEYAQHPIVRAYANLSGMYARIGDVQGMRRAVAFATDPSRGGGNSAARAFEELRSAAANSLLRAERYDDALAIARDGPEATRAFIASEVASARDAAHQHELAVQQVRADLLKLEKNLGTDPNLHLQASFIASQVVQINDRDALDALGRLINQAKATRPPRGMDLGTPMPGTVMLTPGQDFALECYAGMALGHARIGDAAAARKQLAAAEAYLRSIDRQPLALPWYEKWHVPVVRALIENGHANEALAIAKSFPTRAMRKSDVPGASFHLDVLKRALEEAYTAASVKRDRGIPAADKRPATVDASFIEICVSREEFSPLVQAIDQDPSPGVRCRNNLQAALQIAQPATSRIPPTSAPTSRP